MHKPLKNGLLPFRPILSAISTPTYKLAKLVPVLSDITQNEFTVEDSFTFVDESLTQDSDDLYMASLDVDALFTNIPLDEIIDICINKRLKTPDIMVKGISKNDFRDLATKESLFTFNNKFYIEVDGVVMGPPLGPILANIFLSHYEENWLNKCHIEFKPSFYRRYVDDLFCTY